MYPESHLERIVLYVAGVRLTESTQLLRTSLKVILNTVSN